MRETIRGALEQAEALAEQLRRIRDALRLSQGEQLTEAETETQLDSWTEGRGLDASIDAAATHLKRVVKELKWVHAQLEDARTREP